MRPPQKQINNLLETSSIYAGQTQVIYLFISLIRVHYVAFITFSFICIIHYFALNHWYSLATHARLTVTVLEYTRDWFKQIYKCKKCHSTFKLAIRGVLQIKHLKRSQSLQETNDKANKRMPAKLRRNQNRGSFFDKTIHSFSWTITNIQIHILLKLKILTLQQKGTQLHWIHSGLRSPGPASMIWHLAFIFQ